MTMKKYCFRTVAHVEFQYRYFIIRTMNSECVHQLNYGILDKTGLKLKNIVRQNGPTQSSFKRCCVKSLGIYEDKLADARGLNNHRNKIHR